MLQVNPSEFTPQQQRACVQAMHFAFAKQAQLARQRCALGHQMQVGLLTPCMRACSRALAHIAQEPL